MSSADELNLVLDRRRFFHLFLIALLIVIPLVLLMGFLAKR